MANAYYNDTTIKFEHSPVNNKIAFQRETIGAHDYETLSVKDYTDTDANTIYVNTSSGSDSTGTGAKATPFKTYVHGANACTALKTKVIILNSAFVSEDFSALSNAYFEGFYADTGITAKYSGRVLPIVPDDSNSIFVDKTGDDSNAGTAASPKLTIAGAIAATTASKTAVVIQDSGTYEEAGFEFTGNFKYLLAADQCAPTFQPNNEAGGEYDFAKKEYLITDYQIATGVTYYPTYGKSLVLSNGNILTLYYKIITAYTYELYFQISDASGIDTLTLTKVSSTYISNSDITARSIGSINLPGGKFLIFYQGSDLKEYHKIYNNDGTVSTDESSFYTHAGIYSIQWLALTNGNFVRLRNSATNNLYLQFYDDDFLAVGSEIDLGVTGSYSYLENQICETPEGNVFVLYQTVYGSYYVKFNIYYNDGTLVKSATTVESSADQYFIKGCAACLNGNVFFFYIKNSTPAKYRAAVYDYNGDVVKANFEISSDTANTYLWLALLPGDYLAVIFANYGTNLACIVYDHSGNTALSEFTFYASVKELMGHCLNNNGKFLFYYSATNQYKCLYSFGHRFGVKGSALATINGITFDGNDLIFFAKNTAKMVIENCSIENMSDPDESSFSKLSVDTSAEIDFQNNIILDCDGGIYTEENTATIKKNIFARITHGYAVHVKGTAASLGDIILDHNTFFSVYGGIRLEDNGATNEIIKNCIFQDCNVYDILAETTKTFYNSVYTGNLSNATASGCIKANALFVNEGAYDPDDIDLRIKKIILGYYADSPAHGLGLDSLDAGAYNQLEIGGVDSWTSFTVEKPVNGVDIWLEPSEMYKTISQDGTANSKNKGFTEYIELQFIGIKNAEFINFLALMSSTSNQVRIYLDPTTNPNDFQLYRYIPGKVLASAKNFRLGRTGVQDVKILFARKYE